MSEKQKIGRYEIVSELGRGGMGVVFKAWEESLQRFVAIKMLGDQLTEDQSLVSRFLREARAVADLNHPNVVQVFAVDTHDDRPYFAMEYVEGQSLTELISTSNRIEPQRAILLLKEVATGLGAAHDKGVVHRDIKPDNIMLTKHGGVKIVDFGIAKVDDPNTKLTATGIAVGTPNYVSPEVCLGLDIDNRSDLFSLGVVFYEMLIGDTPFRADSPLEMLSKVAHAEVPDITAINPQIDVNLRLILNHMLEKNSGHRYQDAHELVEDINAVIAGNKPAHALEARDKPTMQVSQIGSAGTTTAIETPSARQPPGISKGRTLAAVAGVFALAALVAGWWYFGQDEIADVSPDALQADIDEAQEQPLEQDAGPAIDPGATTGEMVTNNEAGEPAPNESPDMSSDADSAPIEVVDRAGVESASPSTSTAGGESPPAVAATTNVPSEPAAPDWDNPNLVVMVNGDPAIATAVAAAIKNTLQAADVSIIDERFIDGLSPGDSIASMRASALAGGGDVIVMADIIKTGERKLNYAGRTDTQTIANLQVSALLLQERKNLGASWNESLEYVPLNSADKARAAAEPIANELVKRLRELAAAQ